MLIYLLKSGICLAVFYSFYKLLLEKESIHTFKRYYLLTSLIVSFCIPLITFTEYIEAAPLLATTITEHFSNEINVSFQPQPSNYIPVILWSIYGLGGFLFSIKFIQNLYKITSKIKRNPKLKTSRYIKVLLQESTIPHTFFNYIFLNKTKFETNQIPKEVLLHEETHALQKHSLDVLFIEIFQIIFWFNPFIYFIKHSIKLNHEFLADQAVIKNGITPSTYQQILLAFSSNASEHQLANAINYASIKKRFTIMKTQTSKKVIWFRSFMFLFLLAFLIFGFSEKKVVEKPYVLKKDINKINFNAANGIQKDSLITDIYILITKENEVLLNNKPTSINHLLEDINKLNPNLTAEQKRKFLYANIKHQTNTPKELIKNIQNILFKANLYGHSCEDIEVTVKDNLKQQPPSFPIMSPEGLTKEDKPLYYEKLNRYKEWLRVNNPNRILEETKNGFIIKNEKGEIIISTDPNIKSKPFELEKDSPWSISVVTNETNFEDSKKELPTKATPEEIKAYNEMIKKYNALPENKRIIKQKDVNRLEYIYSIMTKEQRAKSETFPKFIPPSPVIDMMKKKNQAENSEIHINERKDLINHETNN